MGVSLVEKNSRLISCYMGRVTKPATVARTCVSANCTFQEALIRLGPYAFYLTWLDLTAALKLWFRFSMLRSIATTEENM